MVQCAFAKPLMQGGTPDPRPARILLCPAYLDNANTKWAGVYS